MKKYGNHGQPHTEINLTKLFDECISTDSLAPYQALLREWCTTYLAMPHPRLGREGPVCPFTAASISKNQIWMGCVDAVDLTADDIEKAISGMVTKFHFLPPTDGPDALVKTILILFPMITDYSVIDEVQRKLKEEFATKGLMIGQFYPGCEEPGIWNPDFRPLQSPIALLAVRHMVSSDFPFLNTKAKWLGEYLKKFAPALPTPVRNAIAANFESQKAQASESRAYGDGTPSN